MKKLLIILSLALGLTLNLHALAEEQSSAKHVVLQTSMGDITIALDAEKAPKTVANFLSYVNKGFYDGVIFHRVINGFMIQGGGFTPDMVKKQTDSPIENEATNGLSNLTGTIAMARTNNPHSATAQFFINVADNRNLDQMGSRWGYAVFGKVIDGMDVVNQIKGVPTTTRQRYRDVPAQPVIIHSAKLK